MSNKVHKVFSLLGGMAAFVFFVFYLFPLGPLVWFGTIAVWQEGPIGVVAVVAMHALFWVFAYMLESDELEYARNNTAEIC